MRDLLRIREAAEVPFFFYLDSCMFSSFSFSDVFFFFDLLVLFSSFT
jgi:hypothetical protein